MTPEALFFSCFFGLMLIYLYVGHRAKQNKIKKTEKRNELDNIESEFINFKPKKVKLKRVNYYDA